MTGDSYHDQARRVDTGGGDYIENQVIQVSAPVPLVSARPGESPRATIELVIKGTVNAFDPGTLINSLSGMLGVAPQQVQIRLVESGSVRVVVEMPRDAAERLYRWAIAKGIATGGASAAGGLSCWLLLLRLFAVAVAVGGVVAVAWLLLNSKSANDVEVVLRWHSRVDLDLVVIDPYGEEIFFENPESRSGGRLEADVNKACDDSNTASPEETISWPAGNAPEGRYIVVVRYFEECAGAGGPTEFEVTIRVSGQPEQVIPGGLEFGGQELEITVFAFEP